MRRKDVTSGAELQRQYNATAVAVAAAAAAAKESPLLHVSEAGLQFRRQLQVQLSSRVRCSPARSPTARRQPFQNTPAAVAAPPTATGVKRAPQSPPQSGACVPCSNWTTIIHVYCSSHESRQQQKQRHITRRSEWNMQHGFAVSTLFVVLHKRGNLPPNFSRPLPQ